jgi:signal transduction histidine kinase/ActR/RegA family two-component response regulator
MAGEGATEQSSAPGVSRSRAEAALAAAGGATAGLGLVVLAGWVFGVERITAVIPGLDPMAFNTALAFGVLGVSLLALAMGRSRPRLALASAGLVTLYGVLTLLQHAANQVLFSDTTVFTPPVPGSVAGRGSPNADLCFLLAGLAVGMLTAGKATPSRLGAALLGSGVLIISLVDLLGYPLSAGGHTLAPLVPQMALHTTVGMAVVGTALVYAGWRLPGGLAEKPFARTGLAVGTVVAILSVLLAQLLRSQERSQIRGMVQVAAQGIAAQLQRTLESRVTTVTSISQALQAVPPGGWERFAAAVLGSTRRGVGWVQPSRPPRWLAVAPGDQDLRSAPWWPDSALLARALSSAAPVEAVKEQGGRLRFGLLVPTAPRGSSPGLLWVITDLRQALEDELAGTSGRFVVVLRHDGEEVIRKGVVEPRMERLWASRADVRFNTILWQVTVWPTPGALAAARSSLPIMTLTAGMLVGLLLGLALALARQARQRTIEIEAANSRLTTEIREREAAEAALRQREEELRQAQKLEAVGRLAGGIAHDYNNILTVIRGNARSLLLRDGMADLTRDALEHIDRAAARGTLLTARLLAFSQRQLLQPETLSLGELAAELREELVQLLGPHVRLIVERQPGVDLVQVDRRWLSQVILDLSFNGREAMPLGGTLWVRTRVADEELRAFYGVSAVTGPAMVLEIEDSGRGMDEATRGRLFEPFFSTKRFGKGSGLALASAYGIVRQSGGEIAVRSVPDRGTRVGVFLPLTEGPVPDAAGTDLSGATVLVAEDEPGILRFIRRTLEQAGCRVVAGASAEEVLEAVERSGIAPDLLVSDIVMPGLSGVELAEQVRLRHPRLAVLFISAYTSDALKEQGIISLGAYLLQKPFTGPELLAQAARTRAHRSVSPPRRD